MSTRVLAFDTRYQLQRIPVQCRKCKKSGRIQVLMNCPVATALASMRAARCPNCRATFRSLDIITGPIQWEYPAKLEAEGR